MSFDAGATFVVSNIAQKVEQVTSDLVCWRHSYDSSNFYLNYSLDLGSTWNLFASITQNGFSYQGLGGAALDPTSGDYGFLLNNGSLNGLGFITLDHYGTPLWSQDGLGAGRQQTSGTSYTSLGWQQAADGSSEWVLLSSEYNNDPSLYQALGCRIKIGPGSFLQWQNFTGITGDKIPVVSNIEVLYSWDVGFAVNGSLCAVALVEDPNPNSGMFGDFIQVQVYYNTSFVFSTSSAAVPTGNSTILSFNGVTSNGQILPDGNYKWTLTFTDLAGNTFTQTGNVTIDNTLPTLGSTGFSTTPARPEPAYAANVTISAEDAHLASGNLNYRMDNGNWVSLPMTKVPIDATHANYTAILPSNVTANTLYWQAVISDTAGNSLLVDNNGQPYSYYRPNLRLQELQDVPQSIDLNKFSNYTVQILVPQDADFMAYVYINYTLDGGKSWQMVNMTAISSSLYNYTFANFSKDVSSLTYSVVGMDIFGNTVSLGKPESIAIFPAMPVWDMSSADQAVVIVISVIIGVVCGVIYSKMVQKKPTLRELTLAEKTRLGIAEGKLDIAEGERQEKLARLLTSRVVPTVVTVVVMGGLLGIAVTALVVFHEPELSMLLLAGLFLATTFMWVLVTDAVVVKTLRSGQVKISKGAMTLVLGVGFSIFLTLLAIIFVGNTVTWWQVRVNQAAYKVMDFTIPKMLTSLASAFFSSIILLSWTVGQDVSRTASQLHEDELDHANPGTVIERRENALARIQGAVGMKGIIFIALIGITIIFASDLSIYVGQGLLIIVPFVIGTFAVLAINAFWKKMAPQKEADIRYDHVTICPECGAETALGGLFCENCGVKIIGGTRIHDGVECPQCRMLNAASGNHCRYCGANLESALASIPASNVEEPPEPDAG